MKKILGAVAVLLVVAAVGVFWTRPVVAPSEGIPAPIALPSFEPTPEPPEPWREPKTVRSHWGQCGSEPAQEAAALRAVLASPLTDDPLFGGSTVRMEAASCQAYRDRIAGR